MIKQQDVKILVIASLIGLMMTFMHATLSANKTLSAQERIAGEIMRFHVLANSNSDNDQEIKMRVKEAVLDVLKSDMEYATHISETREIINNNIALIEETSKSVIADMGLDFEIRASVVHAQFPQVLYDDMFLPSGIYEALQIVIGDGIGNNWWCVMFPMLCFVESSNGSATDEMRFLMGNILSRQEYDEIFEVRFRSMQWFRGVGENNTYLFSN